MSELRTMSCTAPRPGQPTLTGEALSELRPQIPEWQVREVDGEQRLERRFAFDDFAGALAFTDAVGALAEREDHHPALLTEWGAVTVAWWTHTIGGLHRNDLVMAAKSDELYASR